MTTPENCESIEECSCFIVKRCMYVDCEKAFNTDGITTATDDVTSMHEECWKKYDRAWRDSHHELNSIMNEGDIAAMERKVGA